MQKIQQAHASTQRPSKGSPTRLLRPHFWNIPDDLKAIDHWVNWRAEWQPAKGKYTKLPINPSTLRLASSTDPRSWGTFYAAARAYEQAYGGLAGVGFVLTADDDLVGVDLDSVIDGNQQIADLADEWIRRFNSYTELSPSGRGIRIFCKGILERNGFKRGSFEIYQAARYLTVTGHSWHARPKPMRRCDDVLDRFCRELFDEPQRRISQPGSTPRSGDFDIRNHTTWLAGYHETSRGWAYARCPAHKGAGCTSLFIRLDSGAFGCFFGCPTDDIRAALGSPRVRFTRQGAVMNGAFLMRRGGPR
jgi:hypothetical protein